MPPGIEQAPAKEGPAMKTYTICGSCSAINGVDLAKQGRPKCGACHAVLTALSHGISVLDAQQLQRLIQDCPIPVAVDFWAPWCGPCKSFIPVYQQAALDLAGQAAFVKMDTEANPAAGERHHIQSIPTLALFRRGSEKDRISGALPLPQCKEWLGQNLAG
jgi:thioredoxin 2